MYLRHCMLFFVFALAIILTGCSKTETAGVKARPPKELVAASAAARFSFIHAPDDTEKAARRVLEAMMKGDTHTLLQLADPNEVKVLELNEVKLQAIVDIFNRERAKFEPIGVSECRDIPPSPFAAKGGASCTEAMRSSSADLAIECFVFRTPNGPRTLVTQALVQAIMQIRSLAVKDDNSPYKIAGAAVETNEMLRRELQPKGFSGLLFAGVSPAGLKIATWDFIITRSGMGAHAYPGYKHG